MIEAPRAQLPIIEPIKGRLTEAEVRLAADYSTALAELRKLAGRCARGGKITVEDGCFSLLRPDIEACIALLIERAECVLVQLDIELDTPVTALTAI